VPEKKTQSISVLNMDRTRTPKFLKKKENYLSNNNEEKFLDFSSKMEIELYDEEENTKSSLNNNKINSNKVVFKKKTKKINDEKEKEKEKAQDIDLNKLSDVCCSDEIKEKCILF